ncbi:MAG: EamA family transporter [Thiolinea sp.]
MQFRHQLIALMVTFIWGTNFAFIEIGLRELPPFLFAGLRFTLAALPLVFFLRKPEASWTQLASYGFLIGFGQFGLMFWAMQEDITPGLASLVIQIQVFFTILFAAVFFKESIHRAQWFALTICAAGLLLIILYTDGQTTLTGLALILVGALSWAGGNLIVKQCGQVNIIAFIAWSALFAIPPLLAMSFMFEGPAIVLSSIREAGLTSWSVLLWQTIGNTLLGYGLWNMLLNRYSAAVVTPWALLVPVFGMAASALMLAEPMQWWKFSATLLIISGLAINLWASRQS